jgi:hypothetical protein
MTYLLGKKWQDFFDIVICQARKPSFFGAQKRFNQLFSLQTFLGNKRIHFLDHLEKLILIRIQNLGIEFIN